MMASVMAWQPPLAVAWLMVAGGAASNVAANNFIKLSSASKSPALAFLLIALGGLSFIPALGCTFFSLRTLPLSVGGPCGLGLVMAGTYLSGLWFHGDRFQLGTGLWTLALLLCVVQVARSSP